MQADLQQTRRYLYLLDQYPEHQPNRFLFAAFDDKKEGRPAVPLYGTLDQHAAKLQELNEKGYGIFVCVNATTGSSRKSEDISRVRAVWQEDDGNWKGDLPLPPSLTVQTSEGRFHRYWIVGQWPADGPGRQDFKSVMAGMVENYGSDPNAKDISRVLRLPGFYHVKSEPQLVRIVQPEMRLGMQGFTRDQLRSAFGVELEHSETEKGDEATGRASDEDIARVGKALPIIPADDRNVWLIVGMALHHATGGWRSGLRIWDQWSRKSQKYDPREQHRAWDSFKDRDSPITIASVFRLAKKYHNALSPKPRQNEQPLSLAPSETTKRVLEAISETFGARGTNPSDAERAGLAQIALAVQGMAEGTIPRKFYLSALAPGVGKTSAVCEAIRQHKDASAIVFLFRCEEIRRLIHDMALSENEFAVMVSRTGEYADLNKLGNPEPSQARVLFTTQRRLLDYLDGRKKFAEVTEFHYRDQPRNIRVWDETIMPSTEWTVNVYDIPRLFKGCAENDNVTLRELECYFSLVEKMPETREGNPNVGLHLPSLENISLDDFQSWFPEKGDKEIADRLWKLKDQFVRLKRDHAGNTMLHYENMLPDDLAPMVILDASGLQRKTYALWADHRGGLQLLPSPQKEYSPLTIGHWDRGAGKSKTIKWNEIVDGVAKKIGELPRQDKVLVVHHLENRNVPNIEKMIRSRIDREVSFCTWGKHTATNEYRDCKHVILAGVVQYPTSVNEARGRGAKGLDPFRDLSEEEHREIRLGEVAHNILQAACRGALRKSEGNQCPEGCTVWMIISTQPPNGIPQELLTRVFPGATVSDWRPFLKLRGNTKKLTDLLQTMPLKGWPKAYVRNKLGWDHRELHRQLNGRMMQEWMKEQGIAHTTGRGASLEWKDRRRGARKSVRRVHEVIELPVD